jgi:hypothetical protein
VSGVRWEHYLAANIIVKSRDYYARSMCEASAAARAFASSANPSVDNINLSYEVHCVRGDASNNVRGMKFHVCEVAIVVRTSWDDVWPQPKPPVHAVWPDLQEVPKHNDARSALNQFDKQLRCAGLYPWYYSFTDIVRDLQANDIELMQDEYLDDSPSEPDDDEIDAVSRTHDPHALDLDQFAACGHNHVRVFMFCTDNGGDQDGSDSLMVVAEIFQWCLWNWYVRTWCVDHQKHLIVMRLLSKNPGHFCSRAKLSLFWRRSPEALFPLWEARYGRDRAIAVMRKLIPRPIRGRWGSMNEFEKFVIFATPEEIIHVFDDLAAGKVAKQATQSKRRRVVKPVPLPGKSPEADAEFLQANRVMMAQLVIDTPDDETKAYHLRQGRWDREVYCDIHNSLFWGEVHRMSIIKSPLEHLQALVMRGGARPGKMR